MEVIMVGKLISVCLWLIAEILPGKPDESWDGCLASSFFFWSSASLVFVVLESGSLAGLVFDRPWPRDKAALAFQVRLLK